MKSFMLWLAYGTLLGLIFQPDLRSALIAGIGTWLFVQAIYFSSEGAP